MAASKPLRIGLLGCGTHAKNCHAAPMAHYAAQHPGAIELAACCDLNLAAAEEVAATYGFAEACGDIETLYATELDGVVCVMPIPAAMAVGIDVLKRGVPCVIEKPLGGSIEEAEALEAASEEFETPHMVSMNRRFMPIIHQALAAMGSRPIRMMRAVMTRANRTEPGFIWGTGIHAADAMIYMGGDIEDIEVKGANSGGANWYALSMEFANGASGELLIAPTCGHLEESYELYADGCTAKASMIGFDGFRLNIWEDGELKREESADFPGDIWRGDGSYEEFSAFVSALRGERPYGPAIADVMPATELCFELAEQFAE